MKEYKNRQSCKHPGCLNHITHPCEVCGRISGETQYYLYHRESESLWTENNRNDALECASFVNTETGEIFDIVLDE